MIWGLGILSAVGFIIVFAYYIIYPGGKKNWEKRKHEMDQHLGKIDSLESELQDLDD